MRIEDIKYEFPEMPEEIKNMVKREVENQIHNGTAEYAGSFGSKKQLAGYTEISGSKTAGTGGRRVHRMSARRAVVIGLAAAMALGTTAFAGSRLYQIYSEQVGNYEVKISVTGEESLSEAGKEVNSSAVSAVSSETEIPDVKLQLNYLPEGMVQQPYDPLKFHYEGEDGLQMQGGISICAYSMDTGDDSFEVTDFNIISKEEIKDSGREIIYLEKQQTASGESNSILYAFFPEVHHVLQMWCGPDITKEEAVKVAESIELIPLEDGETSDIGLNWAWSSYMETMQETELSDNFNEKRDDALQKVENAHVTGESFPLSVHCYDENNELTKVDCITANVVSVQTSDDLSLLGDSEYIDSNWLNSLDENGKLLPNEIQYIKRGDGINTVDEIARTEEVAQKLVYATVDYTNTGDTVLKDINFFVSLETICKAAEGYRIYDRAVQNESADWDYTVNTGCVLYSDMGFFDYHSSGDHNGMNYIDVLNPGETVTIHMAWIANEDELQYLYLNFSSDSYDPSGIVDIRQ